jgi:hypothetical protein
VTASVVSTERVRGGLDWQERLPTDSPLTAEAWFTPMCICRQYGSYELRSTTLYADRRAHPHTPPQLLAHRHALCFAPQLGPQQTRTVFFFLKMMFSSSKKVPCQNLFTAKYIQCYCTRVFRSVILLQLGAMPWNSELSQII